MQSIAVALPLKFSTGLTIDQFVGTCNRCQQDVPVETTVGSVIWPAPNRVTIEAIAVCKECRIGTPLLLRMNEEGEFTTLIGNQWRTGKMRKTWKGRLIHWWRRIAALGNNN